MSKAIVVDDSKTIRTILRRILVELSFEVLEAANGIEALQVIAPVKSELKLALVDWNMPEMNGLELLMQIRQDAELSDLSVVMVTTEAELGHMTSAMEAGANEYVMKPFTKEILREKLEMIGLLTLAGV
jgi:two-component system, chemotaxis family, chemotaxis protein CheY